MKNNISEFYKKGGLNVVKILITGVNGFIGRYLSRECIRYGLDVIGIGREPASIVYGIKYHQMDLYTDSIDKLLRQYEPDAVIHCAGVADVNYSISYPDRDFALNVMVSRKILYTIKECLPNARFIFLSSAAVYGNPQKLPVTENDRLNPISPYALHKMLVENICQYFVKQFDLDIRILRIFSAYGNGLKKQIFWDMGQKISKLGQLEMFGTGNETRDFIHIADLVNAIFLILNAPRENEVIYNVANGNEISIRKAAEIFCEKFGKEAEIIKFNNHAREGNPLNWCADISRLKKLGYVQKVEIEYGIQKYVEWLKYVDSEEL